MIRVLNTPFNDDYGRMIEFNARIDRDENDNPHLTVRILFENGRVDSSKEWHGIGGNTGHIFRDDPDMGTTDGRDLLKEIKITDNQTFKKSMEDCLKKRGLAATPQLVVEPL